MKTEETKYRQNFFEVNEDGELMLNDGKGKLFYNVNGMGVDLTNDVFIRIGAVDGMVRYRRTQPVLSSADNPTPPNEDEPNEDFDMMILLKAFLAFMIFFLIIMEISG